MHVHAVFQLTLESAERKRASHVQHLFQHQALERVEFSSVIDSRQKDSVRNLCGRERGYEEREGSEGLQIPYSLAKEFQLSKCFSHRERLKQMDT